MGFFKWFQERIACSTESGVMDGLDRAATRLEDVRLVADVGDLPALDVDPAPADVPSKGFADRVLASDPKPHGTPDVPAPRKKRKGRKSP